MRGGGAPAGFRGERRWWWLGGGGALAGDAATLVAGQGDRRRAAAEREGRAASLPRAQTAMERARGDRATKQMAAAVGEASGRGFGRQIEDEERRGRHLGSSRFRRCRR